MIRKVGFDTDLYLKAEVYGLKKRIKRFDRLYLEVGGKLFSDMHAARVLPGYRPTTKIELIKKLGKLDLFYCVSAEDIQKGKIRGDSGLGYDLQTIKDINDITRFGLRITGVIITRFRGEELAKKLKNRLENFGIKVFFQNYIEGYPIQIDNIIKRYESQPYIKTCNKLVVVTGTGGGAGKMGFCLSQIYYERKNDINSGFSKCETFPVWDLKINHPINLAYEASTSDLGDINIIDPYHLRAYHKKAVNYNRDIENYSILQKLLINITKEKIPFTYKSPTDMGVNMISLGIINKNICKKAAEEEIIRRVFRYRRERLEGKENWLTVERSENILKKAGLVETDRKVVIPARLAAVDAKHKKKGHRGVYCGASIELANGDIVTGKNSKILHAESAVLLNSLKHLAGIDDSIDLIDPKVLRQLSNTKKLLKGSKSPSLAVDETIIVLSAMATNNEVSKKALDKIAELKYCEMHTTHIPTPGDEVGLRLLNINYTADAQIA